MKNKTLNQLTHAHGWIGISISGLLFLIFFAGSISLFKDEIYQWSATPTQPAYNGPTLSVEQISQIAIKDRNFNAKEHLSILTPTEDFPYYQAYVDLTELHRGEDYIGLLIDPISGNVIGEIDNFFLPEFMYHLHESLNIPFGRYLMGFVTLFFFIMLLTGTLIHARKLLKRFFLYRTDTTQRSQYLDMHNVVGTISLPFTLMYAFTGLIFNLVIIYQIAFAVVLYKGDQDALFADAGVHIVKPEWSGQATPMQGIDEHIKNVTHEFNHKPHFIHFYNYGDESAVMHLFGEVGGTFAEPYEVGIALNSGTVLFKDEPNNNSAVKHGLGVLETLHFGNFAGTDLRLVYFILGLMVCGLIITGNLLWINKRAQNKNASQRSVTVLTKLTYISTIGVVVATSASFLAERMLPLAAFNRADMLVYTFITALAIFAVFAIKRTDKHTLANGFYLSAALLLCTLACDWILYQENMLQHLALGNTTVIRVQVGLLFVSMLFLFCANKFTQKRQQTIEINPLQSQEAS